MSEKTKKIITRIAVGLFFVVGLFWIFADNIVLAVIFISLGAVFAMLFLGSNKKQQDKQSDDVTIGDNDHTEHKE